MSLIKIFAYQAWANRDLLEKLDALRKGTENDLYRDALQLMNHATTVARIFSAHLQGIPHDFATDGSQDAPPLESLCQATIASDRWYLDYVTETAPEILCKTVAFTFTDGDHGLMSRLEMLYHVAFHSGYHRGEIGRLLRAASIMPPWDTFAVYLHRSEPERRTDARQAMPAS